MSTLARLALLRLASPALPIGGFSYSQGLESAIDRGWVCDEASLTGWLRDAMQMNVGCYEAPVVLALFEAVQAGDLARVEMLHGDFLASRETAELLAETRQMGYSLLRLLAGLDATFHPGEGTQQPGTQHPGTQRPGTQQSETQRPETQRPGVHEARERLASGRPCALPLAWGHAAQAFGLAPADALAAYFWAWLENQVAAAIKAVPLGQQVGQRVLDAVQPALAGMLQRAATIDPDDWSNFAPGLALASAAHENQYSRLFRS